MKLNRIIVLCCIICFVSCRHTNETTSVQFNIESPQTDKSYYNDESILFRLDRVVDPVTWVSSIDGELGTKYEMATNLSAGTHTITARSGTGEKKITITVSPHSEADESVSQFRIRHLPCTCRLTDTKVLPYITALNGAARSLHIGQPLPPAPASQRSVLYDTGDIDTRRLFRCGDDIDVLKLKLPQHAVFRQNALPVENSDEKEFFIINTETGNLEHTHKLSFKRYYTTDVIEVWLPKDSSPEEKEAVDKCIKELKNRILIRVTEIWGKAADINQDNKIAIVFSRTINEEKKAFGFFYSADFFKNNTDQNSLAYNPASNEADIVYAAIPSTDPQNNYFYKVIASTVGHELTHAITFTNKTYNRIQEGKQAARPEVFLDEGLSHLCENLIGDSLSSRNIYFFYRFLNNTVGTSFCKADIDGKEDTPEQRGAMTLFLSWCFWKKGGMDWDTANTVHVVDKGGITFLRKLTASPYTGWEAIGDAFGGISTDELFLKMLDSLGRQCLQDTVISYKKDKLTGEPAEFLPCMGELECEGKSLTIGLPKPMLTEAYAIRTLLPYSFVFIDRSVLSGGENPIKLVATGADIAGTVLLRFVK